MLTKQFFFSNSIKGTPYSVHSKKKLFGGRHKLYHKYIVNLSILILFVCTLHVERRLQLCYDYQNHPRLKALFWKINNFFSCAVIGEYSMRFFLCKKNRVKKQCVTQKYIIRLSEVFNGGKMTIKLKRNFFFTESKVNPNRFWCTRLTKS